MTRMYIVALSFVLHSCVYHRSFVATPFEPVLVKKKGDYEINASMRPFKYYSLNVTAAPFNFMAVRIGTGGFFGLTNINGSVIFFKDFPKFGLFVAPTVNYQSNKIDRRIPGLFYDKIYMYDCEYTSPSIVTGLRFGNQQNQNHQIIIKAQYNIVNNYSYAFTWSDGTASSYAHIFDHEITRTKIPDFISLEASYAFIAKVGNNLLLKLQAGINVVQKTFVNNYSFSTIRMGGPIQSSSSDHPKYLGLNIGIGIIFKGKIRNNPTSK